MSGTHIATAVFTRKQSQEFGPLLFKALDKFFEAGHTVTDIKVSARLSAKGEDQIGFRVIAKEKDVRPLAP